MDLKSLIKASKWIQREPSTPKSPKKREGITIKISIREKNSLLSAAKIPAPTTTSGREAWMDFYKAGPYSDELEIGAWGQSHESALN